MSLPLALANVAGLARNRGAKLLRDTRKRVRRWLKPAQESAKLARVSVRSAQERVRDGARHAYGDSVRGGRFWRRLGGRAWTAASREVGIRRELAAAASGQGPIIVGPWLSEVGYEALYWVPFVRWFADHHRVARERLVVVSRGGVASWYADVADRYVEMLDLFTPAEFAARNRARQEGGDQKQLTVAPFDAEVLARVRDEVGAGATVCHPSLMFQLLRQFWLGNDSLQHVLDYTRHARIDGASDVDLPDLPDDFVAIKFYTGRTLPDTGDCRRRLRGIVERLGREHPIVALTAGATLDEHEDFLFRDLPSVTYLDRWIRPQNNLGVQTEVIRRARLFAGTCGSLAWQAPLLGTETLALYADAHLLAPHIYAAQQVYAAVGAAPFTPLDIRGAWAVEGQVAG